MLDIMPKKPFKAMQYTGENADEIRNALFQVSGEQLFGVKDNDELVIVDCAWRCQFVMEIGSWLILFKGIKPLGGFLTMDNKNFAELWVKEEETQ